LKREVIPRSDVDIALRGDADVSSVPLGMNTTHVLKGEVKSPSLTLTKNTP